jgi:hypothetical protein
MATTFLAILAVLESDIEDVYLLRIKAAVAQEGDDLSHVKALRFGMAT